MKPSDFSILPSRAAQRGFLAGRPRLAPWLGAVAMLAACGCVGSIDDPEPFGPAPECRINLDVEDLFRQRCGLGSCHGNQTAEPAAALDLVSPDPGSRMLATLSTQCDGRQQINIARPDESFLLEKLEGPREGCGEPMPVLDSLTPGEIACVRDWVRQQARNAQMGDAGAQAASLEVSSQADANTRGGAR